MSPEQQRRNRRLGWLLASVVLVFFLGVIVKRLLLGR